MSVPKELNYNMQKPVSAPSTPDILRFRSDNSQYTDGDTIRIEIPTGRTGMHMFPHSTFLEGKITVNLSSTAAAAANVDVTAQIDQSVYAIARRMRITHGSKTTEDQLHCNRLWTSVYDLQKNEVERNGDSINMLVDYGDGKYGSEFIFTKTTAANTAQTANTITLDFNFVLPSAILGSLAQKALPLSLMGASSLYLEIELEPVNVAFIPTEHVQTLNSYTVSDIYLNCKIAKLPSDVEIALIQSTGGRILLPAVSYRGELKTIPAGSLSFNDKFSFQLSSIKNFLFFMQSSASANGRAVSRSVSSRPFCNLSEWYLTLNGVQYPSQNIVGYTRMYTELLRAYDAMNDTNAGGILTFLNYSRGTGADAQEVLANEYRFIAGLDLDRFNHSSDILVSGMNTIGQNVNLNLLFSAGLEVNMNLYAYVMHDVIYTVQNGQLVEDF